MNNPIVALLNFILDMHVLHVLYIFKINRSLLHRDELVLEEHDVVRVVLRLALVAVGHLALVTRENDLFIGVHRAIRLGWRLQMAMMSMLLQLIHLLR